MAADGVIFVIVIPPAGPEIRAFCWVLVAGNPGLQALCNIHLKPAAAIPFRDGIQWACGRPLHNGPEGMPLSAPINRQDYSVFGRNGQALWRYFCRKAEIRTTELT
ncbi:hypothetical protein [Rhizobium sp. NRK18]|uniref:hypothetical protein n=1 Tax=Rhizobium sp. NRK18 TaxID=2964667 RepID=UPI0021C36EDE|nr:hypothetical protein [Rhizobium sp. NRK18]MCQ2002757.1 hypothetical protein [Rhizobium sp. NRK18]